MLEIPQEIRKTLHEIGLDRAEQQVYILLLKKNMLGIQEITNELKLPRSSVHLACENLLNTNVIKVQISGKRRNFYVENPKDINNFINKKEREVAMQKLSLDSILPKISSIYALSQNSESIEIKELAGEDGLVEVFYESLKQPKNSETLRFGGDPEKFTVARDRLKKYREERVKNKIYTRLLLPESHLSKQEIKEAKFKMREVRILPKDIYDPKVQMSVWGESTAITVWDNGLHSIIIKNKAISDTMKQLFEISWKQAKK